MTSRPSGQDLAVGINLGHYRIAEKIGAGGMGEVYRAHDEHLARDVAIKVLPAGTLRDQSARRHFRNEAVGGPKEQQWYFTSHEFNDAQSCHDRREWLTRELGLRETRE